MNNKRILITTVFTFILISTLFSGVLIGKEQDTNEDTLLLRDFHDYPMVTSELTQIANDYPNITALYDLGQSVQGRSIWGLKITDNPTIEENEPEVRICGAHHGDELMSVELPLLLAWHMVENYTVDPHITDLIDNRETWIIPLVNPDGRMANTRRNANNVDINRDYGYIWESVSGSYAPFSQPETQIMRQNALENNYVVSLSFHTSGDVVNYLWNHKGTPIADHDVVVELSNMYGSNNGYWVVEGYDWYRITGDTNDFSYGCRGDMDWTIEVQNYDIPQAWDLNRDEMIEIINASNMGLTGIVTDNDTGLPVTGTVWVEEAYWPCFTDSQIGDYHKLLIPGNYTVHFRANNYEEKVINIEVLSSDEPTVLNVSLDRNNKLFAYQVTWYICSDPFSYPNDYQNNPTEGISALGPPDNISASIGKGGEIVLDMGQDGIISNSSGDDFIVYEGDSNPEGYFVEVSENWNGPWTSLGYGTGTSSFDLADGGIDNAKFVKIIDDNDGNANEFNPGFDLDAIQVLSNNTNGNSITNLLKNWNFMSLPFNQSVDKNDLVIKHEDEEFSWSDAVNNGYVNDYIFGWNRFSQGYEFADTLVPGYGYWIFAYEPCEVLSPDLKDNFEEYITVVEPNWNIVGIPNSLSFDKTDLIVNYDGTDYNWINAVANGYIADNIFGWDRAGQSYSFSSILQNGYCYWLYAYYTCTLKQ